ncbi:hypothetical protein [Microlunatus spumicola]
MERIWAALISLGLLFCNGCAVLGSAADPCGTSPGASAFPGDSLEDWVTYGDHLVVLRGIDEVDQDGRQRVRLLQERTLWSREQAPAAPPQETFVPAQKSHDAAAAKPGHRYLLVGTWWDDRQDGRAEWVHLELLAFDDGVAGRGSAGCPPDPADAGSGRAAVWGRSQTEIAGLFSRTPPDPASVRYQNLGPDERWQRVAAAR